MRTITALDVRARFGQVLDEAAAGWLWGSRSRLLATTDGGATWTPLGLVDDEARMVTAADAWAGGAGVTLVWDPDRQTTLLEHTSDGATWKELHAFPAP
jgi:photosystem II stability/assembly factor-like uncharacterized protein